MTEVKEWQGVTIGMWADTVLKDHPNTDWVKKPTSFKDVRSIRKKVPDLIVTWHYEEADITLEYAMVDDPMYGKISVYAVQKIELKGDADEATKPSGEDKGHVSGEKRRRPTRRKHRAW